MGDREVRPRLKIRDLQLLLPCLEAAIEVLEKQRREGETRVRRISFSTKEWRVLFDRQAEANARIK